MAWFSPSEPRKIIPLTPESSSASTCLAVESKSIEPSRFIWVVIAGNTPCQ